MQKQTQVTAMFDDIAPRYDFLNHFLSLHIDKIWRRKTAKRLAHCAPKNILDIATGTGDMVIQLAKRCPTANLTGIDLSEKMLAIGKEKIEKQGLDAQIRMEIGDACALPYNDNSFDAISVAFGARNFSDLEAGLREMQRVLTDDGHVAILEFSMPKNKVFRVLYNIYFTKILPCIGKVISKNSTAYDYLPISVAQFPHPDTFINIISDCGLECSEKTSLSLGIATLYLCRKKQKREK